MSCFGLKVVRTHTIYLVMQSSEKKCSLLAGSDFFLSRYVGVITTCISTRSEISHLTESDYISYSFQMQSFDFCLSLMLDYFNWQKKKLELIDF